VWASSQGQFSSAQCSSRGEQDNQVVCQANYAPGSSSTQAITVSYSGDAYQAPSAGAYTLFIGTTSGSNAAFVSATCSQTYPNIGDYVTCTAIVATANGQVATGTVSWSSTDHATFSQSSCNTYENAGELTCTAQYKATASGEQVVTAAYPGDKSHGSASGAFVVFVQNPSASLAQEGGIAVAGGAFLGLAAGAVVLRKKRSGSPEGLTAVER
jgi:hypothetical protein